LRRVSLFVYEFIVGVFFLVEIMRVSEKNQPVHLREEFKFFQIVAGTVALRSTVLVLNPEQLSDIDLKYF
jgi:hypothetical protein